MTSTPSFTTIRLPRGGTLPHLCVKCGVGGEHDAREETFRYRPRWARLLGKLGRVFDREATFYFWVCPACGARWKRAIPLAIATFLGAIVFWIVGAVWVIPLLVSVMPGVVSAVVAILYFVTFVPFLYALDFAVEAFVYRPLVVRAKAIDSQGIVTLSGVHPDIAAAVTRDG